MHARCWLHPGVPRRPAVVLIHGLSVASPMCAPTARRLAPRFHVYAPDLPGFGRSDKPRRRLDVGELADALGSWIQALGLHGAVLVGTSVGCQVAVDLAARRRELVGALVLASPTVDRDRRDWSVQAMSWLREQRTHSRKMRIIMVRGWLRAGIRRSLGTFALAMADRVEDKLANVPQPSLVLYGTRDPLMSPGWAGEVARRLQDGHLRVLPGVVHNMAHENPLELSRVTTHFLSARIAPR